MIRERRREIREAAAVFIEKLEANLRVGRTAAHEDLEAPVL
jgi:hypothetical protein